MGLQGLQMHGLLVLPFSNDGYLLISFQWPSFHPSIPRIDMVITPSTNLGRLPGPWPLDGDPGVQVSSTAYDCCRWGLFYTMHEERKRTILFPETSVNHLPHVGGSPAQIREGLGAVHSTDIWLGARKKLQHVGIHSNIIQTT